MRVERRDGNTERQVLTGMIVSRHVLGAIAERWNPKGMFSSAWANRVAGWCVEHWNRTRTAPGPVIRSHFAKWAEGADRDLVRIVEDFLAGLSDEYERLRKHANPGFVLDQATDLFDRVAAEQVLEEAGADLEAGDVRAARERLASFRPVEVGQEAGLELPDRTATENALDKVTGPALINYPGALGNFFGHMLGRQQFVALWGREKVGKSFWGLDLVWEGVRQGNNVAYVVTGDMSRDQVIARLASRAARRPVRNEFCKWPVELEPGPKRGDRPVVKYEEKGEWGGPMPGSRAAEAMNEALTGRGTGRLLLSCHPGGTLTAPGMETVVDRWCQRNGLAPDVIVCDYADLFAPVDPKKTSRDQVNETWMALSALRLKLDCLVVTLTQADAASYSAWLLNMDNFSEDKRKLAHPTGVVGINRTGAEREEGLYRLNWVCGRDVPLGQSDFVWAAGCLGFAAPAMFSTF